MTDSSDLITEREAAPTQPLCVEGGFDGDKEPWDAFWGQRYAQVRDPDGVPVAFYAAL